MAVVTTQPFAMAGNQIFPMGQQKRPWSQGLCECYKKPLICLCGLCLGPCLFCTTVDKLGENGFKYFCLSYCCGCPMGVAARSLARDKYNIMISKGGYPVIQSKSSQDQTQQYMARFTAIVLRHKYCLLYTKTAWQYGCYCGIVPNDCSAGDKPKDCLDSCCQYHSQCFKNLPGDCSGLEPFTWKWREDLE
eukprot:TCALIF_13438-PA protein Name:"Protein of unknown function" AED:0.22 eAED:0.22 QI:371/0.66/0.5/1/0.66/0.5/4/0/190